MTAELARRLLDRTARILGSAALPPLRAAMAEGGFPAELWAALDAARVLRAGVPRAADGLGQELGTLLALAGMAAAHAAPLPLAETLLGHHALACAGLAPPLLAPAVLAPLTIAPAVPEGDDPPRFEAGRLRGRLPQVPWARHAGALVVVVAGPDGARTILAGRPAVVAEAHNLADEPRDLVALEETPVLAAGAPGQGLSPAGLHRLAALFRVAALAGVLDQAASLALRHARLRREDGRAPLAEPEPARDLVRLAAEAAVTRAITAVATRAAACGEAGFEIACAVLRCSSAAATGAALAHRILGPAALAPDHPLSALTRRLWAWREEFGGEAAWAAQLGAQARAAGGAGLWPLLTDRGRMPPGGTPA